MSRLRWLLVVMLVFVAGQPVRCDGMAPRLRVGLIRESESVRFSGTDGVSLGRIGGEETIVSAGAGEWWTAQAEGHGVRVLGADGSEAGSFSGGVCLSPSEGGRVVVEGVPNHWDKRPSREYRGVVEIDNRGGKLAVVNVVDVETYLRGVVPSEMPACYPREALKAQAIAARGQALLKAGRHAREGFDLCATQHCQVYGGASSEDRRTDEAVAGTRGEVLVYGERLADTLYASTCGGHTADNEDYWPTTAPVPYLRGVSDFEPGDGVSYEFPLAGDQLENYLRYAPKVNCNQSRYAQSDKIRWWMAVPREEMADRLRESVGDFGDLLDLRVVDRAESGLVTKLVIIGSRQLVPVVGGEKIRKALGGIRSASFAVECYRGSDELPVVFLIWGAGWGHQVGMCQVGAAGLADKGWDYRSILSKYYRGCQVERRY